jgi:hypothetical protein
MSEHLANRLLSTECCTASSTALTHGLFLSEYKLSKASFRVVLA